MTVEGGFPKVNGDILYASEVNRFQNNGIVGILARTLTSGTAIQNIGSILVPADTFIGSVGLLEIYGNLSTTTNAGFHVEVIVSGLADNQTLGLGSDADVNSTAQWTARIPMGVTSMTSFAYSNHGESATNEDFTAAAPTTNPGSPFTVAFRAVTAVSQTYRSIIKITPMQNY